MEVANFSLTFPASVAVDNQIQRLINAGIPCVVSAGNDSVDASANSPARVPGAITVGATQVNGPSGDTWWSGSNFGTLVDILAPGVSIPSAVNGNVIASAGDGTSPAAAHVSGAGKVH